MHLSVLLLTTVQHIVFTTHMSHTWAEFLYVFTRIILTWGSASFPCMCFTSLVIPMLPVCLSSIHSHFKSEMAAGSSLNLLFLPNFSHSGSSNMTLSAGIMYTLKVFYVPFLTHLQWQALVLPGSHTHPILKVDWNIWAQKGQLYDF